MAEPTLASLVFRGEEPDHAILGMSFGRSTLTLTLAPWRNLADSVTLLFPEFRLNALMMGEKPPSGAAFPAHLVGIGQWPQGEQRWSFVIRTPWIGWSFESMWPLRSDRL